MKEIGKRPVGEKLAYADNYYRFCKGKIFVQEEKVRRLIEGKGVLFKEEADVFVEIIKSAVEIFKFDIEDLINRDIKSCSYTIKSVALNLQLPDELTKRITEAIAYVAFCVFPKRKKEIENFLRENSKEVLNITVVKIF